MKESPQVLEWQEEARREGREKGRKETLRQALIHVLEVRFQRVPDDVRSRVEEQSDVPTLRRWFDLALRTDDLEALRRQLHATTD